jgi:threonine synthase
MTLAPSGESLSINTVVGLLSPTLGAEKSADVVFSAAKRLGFAEGGITGAQAIAILEELSRVTGLVGVTARFAKQRTDFARFATASPPRRSTLPPPMPSSRPGPNRVAVSDLAGLLAHTVGQEKSEDAIAAAASRLGILADTLARAEAIAVFEELSKQPGIVGITARFTKGRIGAKFGS